MAPVGRAIVTHARSWYSLSAIRSLGRRGVEVVAGDEVSPTPGALSRYAIDSFTYPNPEDDLEGFVEAVDAAARRFYPGAGVPYAILPMHRETYAVARIRDRLPADIAVPVAAPELIDEVRHKGRLVEMARARDIDVPPTWSPRSAAELGAILEQVTLPAFVKLPTGAGGVGLERVETAPELREAFAELSEGGGEPLIQEEVAGDDYCASCLFDRGRRVAALCYRNVRSFPRGGGPGAIRETVDAPGLIAVADRLLGDLGWHGIAQLDFRWSGEPEDPAFLIEINPRFFSGLSHAVIAGVDYPWLLFALATGIESEVHPTPDLDAVTEAPIVGLLATISEIADNESLIDDLGALWRRTREGARDLESWGATLRLVRRSLSQARDTLDGRLEQIKSLLETYAGSESALELEDDPLPVIGMLYPLAFFARHGRLDVGLLTGVGSGDERAK